jgi:hypothetical protein
MIITVIGNRSPMMVKFQVSPGLRVKTRPQWNNVQAGTTRKTAVPRRSAAYARHGIGHYDGRTKVDLEGRLTRLDFVNPHFVCLLRCGR